MLKRMITINFFYMFAFVINKFEAMSAFAFAIIKVKVLRFIAFDALA